MYGRFNRSLQFTIKTDTAGFYQLRNDQYKPVYFGFNIFIQPDDTLIIHKKDDEGKINLTGNAAFINSYFCTPLDFC